jgi:hypothetical protein
MDSARLLSVLLQVICVIERLASEPVAKSESFQVQYEAGESAKAELPVAGQLVWWYTTALFL